MEESIADIQTALQNASDLLAKKKGRLVVAAPPLIASRLLPPLFSSFLDAYPGITIILKDLLTDEILLRVRTGEVDLAFGTFQKVEEGLVRTPVLTDSLVLICPKEHNLGKRRRLRWKDLIGHPLILLAHRSSLRTIIDRTLESVGCVEKPAYEVSLATTAIGMVEAGLGISILPFYLVGPGQHINVQTRQLYEPNVNCDISIISKQGRTLSPIACCFGEFSQAYIRKKNRQTLLKRTGCSSEQPEGTSSSA